MQTLFKNLFNSMNLSKLFLFVLLIKIFAIPLVKGTVRYRKINFFTTSALFNCIILVKKKIRYTPFLIAVLLFVLYLPADGSIPEQDRFKVRVKNFHARIIVNEDGSMTVHETMRILSDGATYVRGKHYKSESIRKELEIPETIYRSVGVRIQGLYAYYRIMDFEMIEVSMDGEPLEFYIEKSRGASFTKEIYLGPKSFEIPMGTHELTLSYRTDRHIAFFPDHDEIFWWVFGGGVAGWASSIDTVAVTVELPPYTHGVIQSLEDHSWSHGTGKIQELLQRAAESGEGNVLHYGKILSEKKPYLSVVVSTPKGVVHEPDMDQHLKFFLRDMYTYLPGLIGLLVFFAYYIFIWARVGRDPAKGAIVTRYKPPRDYSPAAARSIIKMGYDHRTFASALISLAAKGVIKILGKEGQYTVERTTETEEGTFSDERVLYNALFEPSGKTLPGSEKTELNAITIHKAIRRHRKHLKKTLGSGFFVKNAIYVIPGIIISLIVAAINYELVDIRKGYVNSIITLVLWTLASGLLLRFLARKKAFRLKKPSKLVYLLLLFPVIFYSCIIALVQAGIVFKIETFMFTVPLFIMTTAHIIFYFLLRAPTRLGRKALDEIEGFETYLAATEGDRLDRMIPPEKTPALFQEYLPYALALDVEHRWSEKFAGEIDETYTLPPLDIFLEAISRVIRI